MNFRAAPAKLYCAHHLIDKKNSPALFRIYILADKGTRDCCGMESVAFILHYYQEAATRLASAANAHLLIGVLTISMDYCIGQGFPQAVSTSHDSFGAQSLSLITFINLATTGEIASTLLGTSSSTRRVSLSAWNSHGARFWPEGLIADPSIYEQRSAIATRNLRFQDFCRSDTHCPARPHRSLTHRECVMCEERYFLQVSLTIVKFVTVR